MHSLRGELPGTHLMIREDMLQQEWLRAPMGPLPQIGASQEPTATCSCQRSSAICEPVQIARATSTTARRIVILAGVNKVKHCSIGWQLQLWGRLRRGGSGPLVL
jgi:hypothetical protein